MASCRKQRKKLLFKSTNYAFHASHTASTRKMPTDDGDALPTNALQWIAQLGLEQNTAILVKQGFETMFALGLLNDVHPLLQAGMWPDDARRLMQNIQLPRLVLQRWSPFLTRIPTNSSVSTFLRTTPVPLLAQHSAVLAENGFDTLVTLKHIRPEDCALMKLPWGHSLALSHIAALMNDVGTMPNNVSIPLDVWLAHITPPMHRYSELIRLEAPRVKSVELLFTMTREEVEQLLIPLGHRRVLWHYIVKGRTHWIDIL